MNYSLQIYFQKANTQRIVIQRWTVVFVVILMLFTVPASTMAQKGSKIRTVVIDPGHGGKDPGAIGKRSKEKDIVLDVALRTGNYIKQYLPDVQVIYTRTKDEFVELHRRAAIANQNNADVFISIHCNSVKTTSVNGSETFVMGDHRSQANLEVAKLENAAILYEENADDEYGGFDPNSTAAYIALSLYQSEYKNQSIQLAQKIQEQFTTRVGRKDRSVQQAGFLVLYRTTMPSVLVELGFISNQKEEAFLMSEEGKVYMASAIYRAFKEFKLEYERENTLPPQLTAEQRAVLTPDFPLEESATTPEKQAHLTTDKVIYRVQFLTSPNALAPTDHRLKNIAGLYRYEHNALFKYTSGAFNTPQEAQKHQQLMKQKGFRDAFVAAFYQDKRISNEEAQKLTNFR
ncbi:MAG: N-acetylmuramoyl-L-alanine amidase [Bacteroidales bacterium]|jgi:N-acetylmuramoyl-L-alanine amidase|nr:N-acetylmuramoyl-L-alanine amidase [Bacteroidales bacterium]HOI33384.1 N-acetylmuramoyl-L-alanine amidase [Bacteroidales bacterium]